MKKVTYYLGLAFLWVFFLGACAPRPVSPATKESFAAKEIAFHQASFAQPWEEQWKALIEAARKEGRITIYSTSGPMVYEGLAPTFLEKYGIKMEFISAKPDQITEKIAAERRAGIYIPDLYIGGNTPMLTFLKPKGYLDPIESVLLLPEVKDPSSWLWNSLGFLDKDHLILSFTAYPSAPLGFNTNLIKAGDIKSYNDLLSPRWKGKLLMNDPTVSGTGGKWFMLVSARIMNLDYMRQLAKQEPMIIRDLRIQLEWLAQGKYPILIVPHSPTMSEFKKAGAPVNIMTPVEGAYLTSGSGNVSLMNRAPHPNAARLFINWLLTREAGLLWQKAMGQQSSRIDVLAEFLDPGNTRQAGIKYVNAEDEEILLKDTEYYQMAREIFGHLMK